MRNGQQAGFTLIELLVVIAIIGMLASIVLASLSTTRSKGQDAALKSDMHNLLVQAEIVFNNNTPGSYNNLCTNATIVNMFNGIISLEGLQGNVFLLGTQADSQHVTCHMFPNGAVTKTDYAIEAPMPTSVGLADAASHFWCIDSRGKSEEVVGAPPTGELSGSLTLAIAYQCP